MNKPGSVICIKDLRLQAGRLRSHVSILMTDPGLYLSRSQQCSGEIKF